MPELSPLEREVVGAIQKDRLESELRSLVRIRSITGTEDEVQDACADLMDTAGLSVRRVDTDPIDLQSDPDWPGEEMPRTTLPVVEGLLGDRSGKRILLAGHVDVVPPGDQAKWTKPIWEGLVEDGKVYGRGAVDMKGGVVATIAAARALHETGVAERLRGTVAVATVPSEEDGGQGMLAAIRAGVTGDAAVITEPTRLDIAVAHAGSMTFRLAVPGRAAHASMRREGVSALHKLGLLLEALDADEASRNSSEMDPRMRSLGLPYPTIVGKVRGGDWASTVMDRVEIEGRYGVRLGQTIKEAEADLRACLQTAWESDEFLRSFPLEMEVTGGRFASASIPDTHDLPVRLRSAASDTLGERAKLIGVPYGADMRLLIQQGGVPTVMFGPGDVAVAHSADEFVPLDDVADCAASLAVYLMRELL
ncbi:MAG: ArgE/DapE family deacylase [Acidimicrobiia bacterium]|nr:ArgE/DapE family deacylase [Acidimicrobiia bacterium]